MPPKKKAANGYRFAEPLPSGTVLIDSMKKQWKIGPSIGKGGFGEIYSAQAEEAKGNQYPYVVKIEPIENGPLFVEKNFYLRNAKVEDIEDFKKAQNLKFLGMPICYGSGSHDYKGEKYRFLVMDKFATDLYKLYIDNNKVFPTDTVFKVALQLLDVLEYIHQRGYVHADIKAANVLLGATKETQNRQSFLVDFGLASKFSEEKEFKPNPKKAHDGTIEFLSRDAHDGVQTRRGDLEILAYNLIQWLGCKLPWESKLSDPKIVQKSKVDNMASVPKMIKACFGTKTPPNAIVDYLNYLKTLKFDTAPDYKKIRTIFLSGIKEGGGSVGTPLKFSQSKSPAKRARTPASDSKPKKVKASDAQENNNPRGRRRRVISPPLEENGVEMNVYQDLLTNTGIGLLDPESKIPTTDITKNKNVEKMNTSSNRFPVVSENLINNNSDKCVGYNLRKRQPQIVPSKPLRKKNDGAYSDTEILDDIIDDIPSNVNRKRGAGVARKLNKKATLNKRVSKSLDHLASTDSLEGFTEAMKEIMNKKMEKNGKRKKVNQPQKNGHEKLETSVNLDDSMAGFTDEMKMIALKKKTKTKAAANGVSIATTSKASDKRGLVKTTSKRLREKPPKSHGEVCSFSDSSVSE